MYAAIGVLSIYVFQATTFVAFLYFDEKRVEAKHDACCCCYQHKKNSSPNKFSQKSVMNNLFSLLAAKLTKVPVKCFVLLATSALFGAGFWGLTQLKQEFKAEWLFDPESEGMLF